VPLPSGNSTSSPELAFDTDSISRQKKCGEIGVVGHPDARSGIRLAGLPDLAD
jgi:hypothetical protein